MCAPSATRPSTTTEYPPTVVFTGVGVGVAACGAGGKTGPVAVAVKTPAVSDITVAQITAMLPTDDQSLLESRMLSPVEPCRFILVRLVNLHLELDRQRSLPRCH